jgi:hypothetical protein
MHVQRLVSVVKMATALEKCITEDQRSALRFLRAKGLNAKHIHKEIFPVYGGVCRLKRFTNGSRNSLKDVRKPQMMADQARNWLRQQS